MSLNLKIGKLGSAIDSATTGHFLSKGATDGVFQAVSSGLDSATITNLVDSAYIQLRDRFQDSSGITAIVDSAYVQARQSSVGSGGVDSAATIALINNNTNSGFFRYKYSATAGQTAFQDSDLNGNVMSFDPNSTLVFYNGVLLNDSDDYTASSNTVTLTSGADAGSQVSVVKYGVGYTPPDVVWGGDRGIFAGGYTGSSRENVIQYFNVTTPSNTTDFGDMSSGRNNVSGTSSTTRGLILGGYNGSSNENTIEYVTIASPSNASDFGDLTFAENAFGSMSDGTYAAFARYKSGYDGIQYVTIATTANAQNFGNMNVNRTSVVGCSNNTYGIICGGSASPNTVMDYITMATPGNASDFGDMLVGASYRAAASDATRGVISGGNASTDMEYITTTTPSNGVDFGDLTQARNAMAACSNETRAVFSSGQNGASYYNTMDYVTIQTLGNATDFGDLVSTVAYGSSFAGAAA